MQQVYFILNADAHAVKIGYTSNLDQRVNDLQVASPSELKCILLLEGGEELEKQLHRRFSNSHIRGEWFSFTKDIQQFVAKHRKLTKIDKKWIAWSKAPQSVVDMYLQDDTRNDFSSWFLDHLFLFNGAKYEDQKP